MKELTRAKKGADPLLMGINYDPENIELKKMLQLVNISNKKILEIGCGIGRVTTQIAKITKEVYAIDVDEEVLKVAKRKSLKLKLKNIKFDKVSADKIKYPDKFFDVVLCPWSIHHISKKDKTFRQIKRVLKRNGYLVIIEASSKNDYTELSNLIKTKEKRRIENRASFIFRLAKKHFQLIKKIHFVSYYLISSKKKTLDLLDVYKVPIERIDAKYLNKFLEKRMVGNNYKISESGYIATFRCS